MATSKGGGSTKNGRDSAGKRLGVKAFGGMIVPAGSILARQKGTTFKPGLNVGLAKDHTLFAKVSGVVKFEGAAKGRRLISILPQPTAA